MADLLDIAERVAGWARDGEQVEAYVAHARDTDVRVYQGEIEQFSSAETQGIGVRVIAEHRQGFAYAGALDDASLRATLDEARDNASFGTEDEFLGLAEPDGVAVATLDDLWRRHFLDSAQLLNFLPKGTENLVDLGSGAGFPGLVLAVLGVPGVELIRRGGCRLREVIALFREPPAEPGIKPGGIESPDGI